MTYPYLTFQDGNDLSDHLHNLRIGPSGGCRGHGIGDSQDVL